MSHNFGEFRRNLLSLILHSIVDFEKKNFSFEYQQFSDNDFRYAIKRGILSLC